MKMLSVTATLCNYCGAVNCCRDAADEIVRLKRKLETNRDEHNRRYELLLDEMEKERNG